MKRHVIALLVVTTLIAVACGGTEGDSGDAGLQEFGTPEVEGAALTRLNEDGSDPSGGVTIPKVVGEGFDGSATVIDPADGRAKIIVFLAHWCPHCQNEVPVVQEWLDAGSKPAAVDLYSVATGTQRNQPNYPPSKWLIDEGWTPPVLVDDETGTVAVAYGLHAFPYWVFVDAEGRVIQRAAGSIPIDIVQQMADLMAG